MLYWLFKIFVLLSLFSVHTQAQETAFEDLELSQLMNLEIQNTSVMKRSADLKNTPASIYVLTADKIKASGAQDMAAVIDLIPNTFLRYSANNHATVSLRSTPTSFTSGVVMMIDGRQVYDPLLSTVPWYSTEISVNNIERVELIRGGGGQLWSSRAASGVINIITKHSLDNQKNTLTLGAGSKYKHISELQLSGLISENGSYNFNVKSQETDRSKEGLTEPFDGQPLKDLGFRIDYSIHDDLSFLITGDYFRTDTESSYGIITEPLNRSEFFPATTNNTSGSLMFRIDHHISEFKHEQLQFSYSEIDAESDVYEGGNQLININYAINYHLDRHKWGWGLDYQHNQIYLVDNANVSLQEGEPTSSQSIGGYFEHEYLLSNDKTRLFTNLRLDEIDDSFEYQPAVKLTHDLTPSMGLWATVSRSVITPSIANNSTSLRVQSDIENPFVSGALIPAFLLGNPDKSPEVYKNFEIGYRATFQQTQLDFSAYHSYSNNATAAELEVLSTPQLNVLSINGAKVKFSGAEVLITHNVSPKWQLEIGASILNQKSELFDDNNLNAIPTQTIQQYSIRSDYQINDDISSYIKVTYESELKNEVNGTVPSYTTLDLGLNWQVNQNLFVGLYGQNLFSSSHYELPFNSSASIANTKIEQSFLLKAEVSF